VLGRCTLEAAQPRIVVPPAVAIEEPKLARFLAQRHEIERKAVGRLDVIARLAVAADGFRGLTVDPPAGIERTNAEPAVTPFGIGAHQPRGNILTGQRIARPLRDVELVVAARCKLEPRDAGV
jgi:hypothetical protein